MNKIIDLIKKKWIKNTLSTAVLIIILIALFVAVNIYINKINSNPIDFTEGKLYSLSDESVNQVKNIDKEVHIYFFGYDESDKTVSLAKQYSLVNEKITAEAININSRLDLAKKYGIDSDKSVGIIVEGPDDRYKVLKSNELYTYEKDTSNVDTDTIDTGNSDAYKTIDVTEQKLTNAIIDTTVAKIPNIYFVTGHDEYSISNLLMTISVFIKNDINTVSEIDLLQNDIPEDCDVLVMVSPEKDYTEIEADKILAYVNKGNNILWLGKPTIDNTDMPNLNKVLSAFGMKMSKGIVMEQNPNNAMFQSPELILVDKDIHPITEELEKIVVASTAKLDIEEKEKLQEQGITVKEIIESSEYSFYREDFNIETTQREENEPMGPFVIGAEFVKKVDNEKEAKLIAYADTDFISDRAISSGNKSLKLVNIYNNKDLILNSIAYLTDREDAIKIRKDAGNVSYTASRIEDLVVRIIIFVIPIIIIAVGIIIWQIRRRKK